MIFSLSIIYYICEVPSITLETLKFLNTIILCVVMAGHAFEARIYAENVPKGFLPATGVLHHYRVPVSSVGQLLKIAK